MSLGELKSVIGVKKLLLDNKDFKSIQQAVKHYNSTLNKTFSNDEVYEIIRKDYNEQLKETFRKIEEMKQAKKQKRQAKKEQKRPLDNYRFMVFNIPDSLDRCYKALDDFNERDAFFSYRNLISRRQNKVNAFTFDIKNMSDIQTNIMNLYKNQKNAFKINIQFGFIFQYRDEDNFLQYTAWNATSNKFLVEGFYVNNKKKVDELLSKITYQKIEKYITLMSPSSSTKTIGAFQMRVKIFDMEHRIGANIPLPDYILKSQNINSMVESKNNMCFWNCLAYHQINKRECYGLGKELYETFYGTKPNKSYGGFDIFNEVEPFETKIKIGINIFELDEESNQLTRIRHAEDEENYMNLLLYNNHFSYIKRLDVIDGTKYKCQNCGNCFNDNKDLRKHLPTCEDFEKEDVFEKFPTVYEPQRNLIVRLNETFYCECDFRYEPLIVFDFESLLLTMKDKQISKGMKLNNQHQAVSVSIYSNVEGFKEEVFIENKNPETLISEMFDAFDKIADVAINEMKMKFRPLYNEINKITNDAKKLKYIRDLNSYVERVPILGFNSGNYDLNLNINEFMSEILKRVKDVVKKDKDGKTTKSKDIFSIKNGNTYKALSGGKFLFLDICQYIPPNYNLDAYIKAFNPNGMKKSIFPYEFLDSYDKLDLDINVLTRQHFFSKLKNKGISTEEWFEFKDNKIKYGWKTIKDLLKYYNNLDVKPFLEAVINQRNFFYEIQIDMFKDGFSLPGLSEKVMFSYCFEELNNEFIKEKPKPNHNIQIMNNIYHKLQGYKKQDLDSDRYDDDKFIEEEEVKEILCNQGNKCLYCWKTLKTDDWSLDRVDNNYGHNTTNCIASCIKCNTQRKDEFYNVFYRKKALVRYSYNHPLVYLIDEENKEVFNELKNNITGGPSIVFHRHHEAGKTKIKRPVYRNGEWEEGKEGNDVKNITGFDANALYLWGIGRSMPCGRLKFEKYDRETDGNIYNDFINDFNGFIKVNIHTPENLKEYMSEFPLIFKNIEYDSNEVMGDYMKTVYDDDKEKRMTKKLISSFKGEEILIKSDRLKWLIKKGLVVSKIHGYIRTQKGNIFEKFVKKVSDERRKGDLDKKYAIIAEMWKLIGNSAFGRTGMNKNKFHNTVYGDVHKYNKEIGSILFKDANEYGDLFEINKDKRKTKQNIPIQIACSIYDDAKLKMSSFYYDCVDKYISRDNYQYIEMDTDSAYMALCGDNFESLVKPEMREEFEKDKHNWFLRTDTDENKRYDNREPGLFKLEYVGKGIWALGPKTYKLLGFDGKTKMSCKGIQKANNEEKLGYDTYGKVCMNNIEHKVVNRGFRILNQKQISNEYDDVKEKYINNNKDETNMNRHIYMYETTKTGLTGKYDKRRVLNDRISTVPLDI